jgi:hypothetical protein
MISKFQRVIASLLVVCVCGITVPLPALAGMIETQSVATSPNRDRLASMLDRADIVAQLELHGVNSADVKARVAALTDEEAAQLAGKMDNLPAGGLLELILIVFLVLLLTDILGYTKIFPFTKPMRR